MSKLKDDMQTIPLKVPEIRVWCHPHKIGKDGIDYYEIFNTFNEAMKFIQTHKEAESIPLVACYGYEYNVFDGKEISNEY